MKSNDIEIVDFLPKVETLPDGTRYGMNSVCLPDGKRILKYSAVREWEGVKDTETAFTRTFMKTLPTAKCRKSQRASFELSRPPLYVSPGPVSNAAYVDITAAYPTLYRLVGWRVEYLRGKYFAKTEPLYWPYPQKWKAGRSYVVTGARPRQVGCMVKGGKVRYSAYRSQFSNPSFVASILDSLAAVARLAVTAFGFQYWNVDGGIVPAYKAKFFIQTLEMFGISAKVKYSGDAFIFNSGYWYVGEKLTLPLTKDGRAKRPAIGDKIPLDDKQCEWLLERLAR